MHLTTLIINFFYTNNSDVNYCKSQSQLTPHRYHDLLLQLPFLSLKLTSFLRS
jgi:hypothetical protein